MNKVEIRNYFQECGILNKKFGRNFNWKTVLENNKQYLDLFDNYKQNYRSEDEAWFCLSKNIEPPLCQVCGENLCKLGEKKYNTVCTECSANKSKNKLIKYQNSINKRTTEDKKNILNKRKKTCLEKYGEENYQCFGSTSFRKKMLDKYGSEFYNNKEKAKHTVQINKLTEDVKIRTENKDRINISSNNNNPIKPKLIGFTFKKLAVISNSASIICNNIEPNIISTINGLSNNFFLNTDLAVSKSLLLASSNSLLISASFWLISANFS